MTDHPIIFSAPMVRALLEGRKTTTRRLAWGKPIPGLYESGGGPLVPILRPTVWQKVKPGDRLYVREAFSVPRVFALRGVKPSNIPEHNLHRFWYWADGNPSDGDYSKPLPSIHMPRWASRLTLIVTKTKIERVQDIEEWDAIAEGAEPARDEPEGPCRIGFMRLWDKLHGVGSWDANPEVVALTFTVHKVNIDKLEAKIK